VQAAISEPGAGDLGTVRKPGVSQNTFVSFGRESLEAYVGPLAERGHKGTDDIGLAHLKSSRLHIKLATVR
jgi:hypothetical protein